MSVADTDGEGARVSQQAIWWSGLDSIDYPKQGLEEWSADLTSLILAVEAAISDMHNRCVFLEWAGMMERRIIAAAICHVHRIQGERGWGPNGRAPQRPTEIQVG
ncbi:hypothetical protein HVZ60_17580 [Escherichia coli]|nr:hypothetical protein [Escherichia coli]